MTTPTQPQPYSVQASCELSQDYFLTTDIVMQANDEVIPFINPYLKQVEAIVFSASGNGGNGAVYHLQRDPAASTGWTPVTIDYSAQVGSAADVAVADDGSAANLMIYGDDMGNGPVWVTSLTGAATWDPAGLNATWDALGLGYAGLEFPVSSTLESFKGGIDPHGYPYFYASVTDTSSQTTALIAWVVGASFEGGLEINYQVLQILDISASGGQGTVVDYNVLFDSAGGPSPVGYSLVLTSNKLLSVYAEQPYTSKNAVQFQNPALSTAGSSGVDALLAAWATPGSQSGVPGYVFQAANATWFAPEDGSNATSLADNPASAPNSVTVWRGDLDVVNLLDDYGVLHTCLETAANTWAAPIPVLPGNASAANPVQPVNPPSTPAGLQSIFGVPTDLTQSTLFAIGLDDTLSVLTLDSSGWTQTLVRQDGNQQVEIDSYRVQVSVLDANGTPVPGASVQVGTDRPVGFWQPSGGSYLTPAAPVTLTADATGMLVFSVPAEELDCAVLTVQAPGSPNTSPLTVIPDTDVRGFFNGTGMLTDLGTLNGGNAPNALLVAKNSSGGDLFPGLTGLTGDAQQQALKDSATALSTFITAGTRTPPVTIQSLKLIMTGRVPSVQLSTEAFAFGDAPADDLTFSLGHLFDTIGHALRHGAAKLASIAANWTGEATGWVVSIGAEIAGVVQNFANLVITDMKDAYHAIGGFFQALGADIDEALQWLKHNVLALLKAAWDNGEQIATFIGTGPAAFSYQVQKLSFETANFFTSLTSQANTLIGNVETAVTGETLAKAPQQTDPTDTGSSSAQSGLAKDFGLFTKVINDTPGMWLYHKLQQDVPPVASLGLPTFTQASYTDLVTQMGTDWTAGKDFIESVWTFLSTTFQDLFGTTSAQARATDLPTIFTELATMVDNFLSFCDDVAQTVLLIAQLALQELGALLTTPFQLVSATSLLGQVLDLLGIDPTVQLDKIMGMIVAFPATLVAEVLGKGNTMPALPALPASDSDAALAAAVADDDELKLWLGIIGGTSQAIWGLADIIGDLQTFTGEDGERGEQSGVITMFDIWCPVFETAFLYPLPPYDELEWAIAPIVFTALLPSIFGALGLQSWPGLTSQLQSAVGDKAAGNTMAEYVQPFVQMLSGAANTAFGVSYQVKNDDTYWVDILGSVLGNLSFILAISGTVWLNETTEDVPVMVKMLIDAIGNIGAAICIYQSNSLPPK
jgi:hypothetical protein